MNYEMYEELIRMLLFDAAGNWISTHTQLHVDALPESVLSAFRASEYANCQIDEVGEYLNYDKNGVEVDLSYNGTEIKAQFDLGDQGYVWVSSEWNLNYQQESVVPAAIRKTLDSKYAAYQLYFLKYNETSKGEDYYMAGLKSASLKSHLTVKMNAQGNVLGEYGEHIHR